MRRLHKFLSWLPAVIATTVVFAAQTGPSVARSTLAEWASALGFASWPTWLPDRLAIASVLTATVAFYAWVFWPWRKPRASLPAVPEGDLTIKAAVEYLVNDTATGLVSNPAPHVETVGVAKGQLVTYADRPQQDALRLIEEQLALGTLAAFGRRAVHPTERALGFDVVRRKIPQEYWEYCGLHTLFARIPNTTDAQTDVRRAAPERPYPFTDILLNRAQVEARWERRAFWQRRQARIADPILTEPTVVEVVATARGWDNVQLREPGDRFLYTLRPGERLGSWMRLASEYDRKRDGNPEERNHP